MENQLAGGALVAWLLLTPIVAVLVSAGWGGRHGRARGDELRR
jgi:hypothetical protein